MNRTRASLVLVCVAASATLGCAHRNRVVAPEVPQPAVAESMPVPAETTPAGGASATRVEAEPGVVPATRSESGVTGSDLPADVEAINRAGFLKDAFFDSSLSELRIDARDALAADAQWLQAHPTVRITIEGHCDERNTAEYNLALGWRRANAVRDYLVSLGVAAGRIATISYGEERPFAEGHDEASWAQNRRAHVVVTVR